MDKCDCERQGQKNTKRIAIIDIQGGVVEVSTCCPLCVIDTLGESELGTVLMEDLRAEADVDYVKARHEGS